MPFLRRDRWLDIAQQSSYCNNDGYDGGPIEPWTPQAYGGPSQGKRSAAATPTHQVPDNVDNRRGPIPSQRATTTAAAGELDHQSLGSLTPFLAEFDGSIASFMDSSDFFAWTPGDAVSIAAEMSSQRSSCEHSPTNRERPECEVALVSWRRPHGNTAIAPGMKRIKLRVRLAKRFTLSTASDPDDRLLSPRSDSCRRYIPENSSPQKEVAHGSIATMASGASGTCTGEGASTPSHNSGSQHSGEDGGGLGCCWCNSSPKSMLFEGDGSIKKDILSHLVSLFATHLSCLFPFLDDKFLSRLASSAGPSFLLNAVAAVAARFSTHPAIATPGAQPSDYGHPFFAQAKVMLGSMLSVPTRSTAAALALLAMVGAANDSESEVWMLMGMAVRMSQDLGLHLDSAADTQTTAEDRRCDRVLFWSIFVLDCALSFGVGRPVSTDVDSITQALPTNDDMSESSPFCAIASLFVRFARVNDALNSPQGSNPKDLDTTLTLVDGFVSEYAQIPPALEWNGRNMRYQAKAENSCAYLWLHLWFHALLASIESHAEERRECAPHGTFAPGSKRQRPGDATRTICEIVNLADMSDLPAYCCIPLLNQPLFIAASYCTTSIEKERYVQNSTESAAQPIGVCDAKIFIHENNKRIDTLQSALKLQAMYWSGINWILGSLEQRMQGSVATEVDLERITEQSPNSVTLPDAGLLRSMTEQEADEKSSEMQFKPISSNLTSSDWQG